MRFPDDDTAAVEPMVDLVDDASLVAALRQDAPIENLLDWLHRYEPRWSDVTTLRLYHELVQRDDWQSAHAALPHTQDLNSVRVTLHPHRLTLSADPS